MPANKALRTFTAIPDATMVSLLATVEEGVKKAKKGGVIQRLELSKKGYRHDLVFGDLYIVPASVCAASETFPTILLKANLKHSVTPESMIDFKLHEQGEGKLSSDKLKMAKEEIFTGPDGKEATLIVFCPSWADDLSYVSFPFNDDTIFYFLRDMVFCAPFNPSLSNVFEQMKAMDPDTGYSIESIPAQQNIFKVPATVATEGVNRTFPDFVPAEKPEEYAKAAKRAAARKFRVTAAHKNPEFSDEEVAVVRALEQQIQTNIGTAGIKPFKVDASSLAGAFKRATQKKAEDTEVQQSPEVRGTNIIMPEDPRTNPNDPSLNNVEPDIKAASQKTAGGAPGFTGEDGTMVCVGDTVNGNTLTAVETTQGGKTLYAWVKGGGYLTDATGLASGSLDFAKRVYDRNLSPKKASRVKTMTATLIEAAQVRTYQDSGVSSEGLRSRPDYGEAGSKETISSATVDGPDPKSAGFFTRKDKPADPGIVQAVNSFVAEHSGRTGAYFSGEKLKSLLSGVVDDWKAALAFGESQGLITKDGEGYTVKNRSLLASAKKAVDIEDIKMKGKSPEEEVVPGLTVENISRGLRLLDKVQDIGVELQAGVNTDALADKAQWYLACLHDLRINREVMDRCNVFLQAIEDKPAAWDWVSTSAAELRSVVENAMGSTLVDSGVKTTLEQHDEVKEASVDKQAISLLVPGRVLENFYPELLGETVDHPEVEVINPNAVDPLGANPRSPEGMLTNPEGAPLGDSTGANPGPGGIGGVRAPYQSEGVPLRQEHNVRGTNYYSEFYRTQEDLSPGSLSMAASLTKQAGAEQTFQLSRFLKSVIGDFVGSLLAGYGVSKRTYPFEATPAEFKINLAEALQVSTGLMANMEAPAESLRAVLTRMSDIEIAEALKSAWAQGAVWNDETETSEGFTFEVYARAEKIDPASLYLTLKFVTGIR